MEASCRTAGQCEAGLRLWPGEVQDVRQRVGFPLSRLATCVWSGTTAPAITASMSRPIWRRRPSGGV